MDDTTASAPRSRRVHAGIVALGAAAGLTLAGLGVASAQTDPPAQQPPAQEPPAGEGQKPAAAKHGRAHMGGAGIHGEFTTRAPAGGFQTKAHQVGEVTEVSATSLTVKSEDGFTKQYVVNDDTVVSAGDNGIGDVKQGDQVRVLAVVRDGKAFAVEVDDATQVGARHGKWRPAPARGAGQKPRPSS